MNRSIGVPASWLVHPIDRSTRLLSNQTMPELPEVETIARALKFGGRDQPPVIGRTIAAVDLYWARTLARPNVEELQRLVGQAVLDVGRRGKLVVLYLSPDILLVHLRMSGDLRVEPAFDPNGQPLAPAKHDRAVFLFTDGMRLVFNDPRKFGRIWLVSSMDEVTGGLGPEPLDPSLSDSHFYTMLISRRRQIKPLLLDQSFLAGLGNIYTDEALNLARLHPATLSDQLNQDQAARLLHAIRHVLEEGIAAHGASIDWVYRGGDFQNRFRVYRRTGQPCLECGTPIIRTIIGQRSTHTCPVCQPANF